MGTETDKISAAVTKKTRINIEIDLIFRIPNPSFFYFLE
jgi:hypothetical protein